MDRIIPDDIIKDSIRIVTLVDYNGRLTYEIRVAFCSVDNIDYNAVITHREDGSMMLYSENDMQWQYCFSPYITQKYIKFVMAEYAKNKPNIDHHMEIIGLINRIIQRNLSCTEVEDGKSK